MTKRHDRYACQLDETQQQGPHVALWDVSEALWLLQKYLRDHDLLTERVVIRSQTAHHAEESITLGELFPIADGAIQHSVYPAISVYQRLQQNTEAARLLAEATGEIGWINQRDALVRTLANKAIISRGWVSAARRQIARRAKAQETGGDAV